MTKVKHAGTPVAGGDAVRKAAPEDAERHAAGGSIVWSPSLETGHARLDADHRQLIDRFNRLIEPATGSRQEMIPLLAALYEETRAHFEREETLMETGPDPLAEAHRAEHRRLLDEFSQQVEDWLDGVQSYHSLTHFLYRWLLRHILTMDRALARHLAALSSA